MLSVIPCPHPLYPPMTLHLALSVRVVGIVTLPSSARVFLSLFIIGSDALRIFFSLNNVLVGLVSLLGRSWDGQVAVCGKFCY